ncbi:MAG: AMP-binding protein [Bacteriovoracia bacterium]
MRVSLLASQLAAFPRDFWDSAECEVLVMKTWAQGREAELAFLRKHLPDLSRHVWLATSGTLATAGESSWIAISKEALLASAAAVNAHLDATREEAWGLNLPLAHVSGLGILARAHLSGAPVIELMPERWDPTRLLSFTGQHLSLVPTQVFDLVNLNIASPKTLRTVVVGGDRLPSDLYEKARALGWPVRPSYGMTECGSQIATADGVNETLRLLSHIEARTDEDERLWLSGPALFTGRALVKDQKLTWVPRTESWWGTSDRAQLAGTELKLLGRLDSVVKVRGEKVDLAQLEEKLRAFGVVIVPITDARDGAKLWAVSERAVEIAELNAGLLPHQRMTGVKVMNPFPRSALGKIKRGEVRQWLESSVGVN